MSAKCSTCGAEFETQEQLMAHAQRAHSVGGITKPAWPPKVNRRTYITYGAVGGFLGGIVLALVMMAAGQVLLGNGVAVVCSMGVALIGLQATSTPTTVLGLVIHFVAAILIGIVIAVLTLVVRNRARGRLAITNAKNGTAVGLLAGFAVWLVFGLPLMFLLMIPAMTDILMMMPMNGMPVSGAEAMMMLQNVMVPFVAAWFAGHLLYGAVWGATTGYAAATKAVVTGAAMTGAGATR